LLTHVNCKCFFFGIGCTAVFTLERFLRALHLQCHSPLRVV
jgi:hypothetical protein